MGGFGSGLWADVCTRKVSVELSRQISARFLKDNGFLGADKSGEIHWRNAAGEVIWKVQVQTSLGVDTDKTPLVLLRHGVLSTGGAENTVEYTIELIRTACNYGGYRYWFTCPVVKDGVYCGNRACKLYIPRGGKYFGCRECYDLTYESCQTSHKHDRVFDHIPDGLDLSGLRINQVLRLASL